MSPLTKYEFQIFYIKGSINSSLMALRNCMETLRENILSGTRKVGFVNISIQLFIHNFNLNN